jgi:hypothetical protein
LASKKPAHETAQDTFAFYPLCARVRFSRAKRQRLPSRALAEQNFRYATRRHRNAYVLRNANGPLAPTLDPRSVRRGLVQFLAQHISHVGGPESETGIGSTDISLASF